MAYTRRFRAPSQGSFNITTALQTPEFQQYLLSLAGKQPEKKKAGFFDRLFRLMDTFTWTDDAYDAKRLGLSGGQALGRYLMDIPKTLNVLNPMATKEDLQKDLGKGKELAKLQGMSSPGLSGFLMDILDPSLLIGGVVKGAVGAGSKGLSSVGKEFVEKGAKELGEEIAKKGTKEASEKVLSYVGKELGENAAKTAATRVALGETVEGVLTDVAKKFGKETMAEVSQPGLKLLGKTVIPGKNAGRIGRFIENPLLGGAEAGWAGLGRVPGGKAAQELGTRAIEPFKELLSFGRSADKLGLKDTFQTNRLAPRIGETVANQEMWTRYGEAIMEGRFNEVPTDVLVEFAGGLFDRTPSTFLDRMLKQGLLKNKEFKTVKGKLAQQFGKQAQLDDLLGLTAKGAKQEKIFSAVKDELFKFKELASKQEDLVNTYLKSNYSGDVLDTLKSFVETSKNAILDESFNPLAYKRDIDKLIDTIRTTKAGVWSEGQIQAHTAWLDLMKTNAGMSSVWRDMGRSDGGLGYIMRWIEEEAPTAIGKSRKYLTSAEAEAAGKKVLRGEVATMNSIYEATKYQTETMMQHSQFTELASMIREGLMPEVGRYVPDKVTGDVAEMLAEQGLVAATGGASKIKMFKNIYMPEEAWDIINGTDKLFKNPNSSSALGRMFEKVSGIWRGMQTGLATPLKIRGVNFPVFPAFTIRNKTNNIFEMMIRGGMSPLEMPRYQKHSYDIINYLRATARPGEPTEKIAELGNKLINGTKISDWVEDINKSGIRGGTHIDEVRELLAGTSEGAIDKIRKLVQGDEEKVQQVQQLLSKRRPKGLEVAEKGSKYLTDEEIAKQLKKILVTSDINRIVEDGDRVALYLYKKSKGASSREARDAVARVLFDYSELTPFERNTLRPITSFYTWSSKNIQGYAKMMMENPTRLKVYSKILEGIKGGSGDISQEELNALPDWMQDTLAIYTGRNGNNLGFITGLGSSMDAIAGVVGDTPRDTGMNLLGMMNPALSLPLQATLDRNFFKDKPISEDMTAYQYQSLPEPLKELLGFREEQYMTGDGQIKTTYKMDPWKKFWLEGVIGRLATTTGKASNILAGEDDALGIVNFLSGVKYQERDMDWEIEQRRRELQEELDKQLVDAGLATPKSGVYMNKSAYLNYPSLKGNLRTNFGYNPNTQSLNDKLGASEKKNKDQAYIEQLINQVQTQ